MDRDGISWQTVPNTVTKRMTDLSFVHKLKPSRRLCRRTKVMNSAIKHFHSLKTYRQYVKMKTAILRNLSDYNDTDDNDGFSDNDYSVLYKSDLSVTNYMAHVTSMDTDYSYKTELDISDSNILRVISKETDVQQSKNKSSNNTNLDWKDIVKKKSSTCSLKQSIQESKSNMLNETTNHKTFASSANEAICEKNAEPFDTETCITEMCFNNITCNIKQEQEISENNTKLMENKEYRSNGVYKKRKKENDTKISENKKELNCPKKDSISVTVQDASELSTNTNANLKQSYATLMVGYLKIQQEPADKCENIDSLEMQSLYNGKTNQPKDSGIDEDTEEESQENGKGVCARRKEKVRDICKNANLTSPAVNCESVSVFERTLSSVDHVVSNINDISDATESQCVTLVTTKNINSKGKEENKVQKIKLQPTVTDSKIIQMRYRIISDSVSELDTFSKSRDNDSYVSNKVMEDSINTEYNAEDSMSPLSKRRLQQMRRLNLTVDSESSLSDNDNEYCNTENMRDKLFKRSKEFSDLSDSQDGNADFKHTLSLQNSKRLKKHKNYTFKNNSKEENINLRQECVNNTESIQSLRLIEINSNKHKNTLNCSIEKETHSSTNQYKTSLQNSLKQPVHYLNNEINTSEENINLRKIIISNDKTGRISQNGETATQPAFKNSVIQTRPTNLQELMEQESLIYETALPSVTLRDIEENDVFLLEIPSVVLETELLQQKFVLTKKKLKLGEHKYRIAFNDTDQVVGVLNTGKFHTHYKPVNIKPMKRFVAYQKVVRTTSAKSSDRCTNIGMDHINDTNTN
ncbi:uncharacterized protein LOC144467525 [Augochlora pura]